MTLVEVVEGLLDVDVTACSLSRDSLDSRSGSECVSWSRSGSDVLRS